MKRSRVSAHRDVIAALRNMGVPPGPDATDEERKRYREAKNKRKRQRRARRAAS